MRIVVVLLAGFTLTLAGCRNAENKRGPREQPASPQGTTFLSAVGKFGGYKTTMGSRDPNILRIDFNTPGAKDATLEKLRPLLLNAPAPIDLVLGSSDSITDAGLAHLENIGALQGLSCGSKFITDAGLKHLGGLINLQYLSLSSNRISDAGLEPIGKLTKLRSLAIYSKGVTEAGYRHLDGLTGLEELHAGDFGYVGIGDEGLRHLRAMSKLKELTIGGAKLTDAGMRYLRGLVGLRKLEIGANKVTGAGLAPLAALTHLQKLRLSGPVFSGDALAALEPLTDLDDLHLGAIDKAGSIHVGKLSHLKKLGVGWVNEGGLAGVAKLTNLQELDLYDSFVGDADMKYLSGLKTLRRLNLRQTRVTNAGLQYLAGLPELRDLYAPGNRITDAGLAHLAEIPNLENLNLMECKITGSTFKSLTKLTKLKNLQLSGNPVTDEHVNAVKDIRGLQEVDFTGTKVSEDVVLALKRARPDLHVKDIAGDEVVLNKQPATRPRPSAGEDVSNVKPAFRMNAEQFFKEFDANKTAAMEKYMDKTIELVGEVHDVGRNGDHGGVWLNAGKDLMGVTCVTVDDQPWRKVACGQKIKIKGRVPSYALGAALVGCVFVDTGKYAGVRITATELAKEFAANPAATGKKYDQKSLVLTGEVVSKEFNSAGASGIVLKSGSKIKVECDFTAMEKEFPKAVRVGQTITVFGRSLFNAGLGTNVNHFVISFCLPFSGR